MSIRLSLQPVLRALRYVHALIGVSVILLLAAVTVNATSLTFYRVSGHSMQPTLHDGQVVAVNLLALRLREPARGDVVIVRYADDPTLRFVKRIEGLPGDTVPYQNGSLVLGPGQYFVIGDNRDNSTDSRAYGPVSRGSILGTVIGTDTNYPIWP